MSSPFGDVVEIELDVGFAVVGEDPSTYGTKMQNRYINHKQNIIKDLRIINHLETRQNLKQRHRAYLNFHICIIKHQAPLISRTTTALATFYSTNRDLQGILVYLVLWLNQSSFH